MLDKKILNRKRAKSACQRGLKFTERNKTTKEPLSFTERIDKGLLAKKDERVSYLGKFDEDAPLFVLVYPLRELAEGKVLSRTINLPQLACFW